MKILTSPALSIKICRKSVKNLRYEWVLEKQRKLNKCKKVENLYIYSEGSMSKPKKMLF